MIREIPGCNLSRKQDSAGPSLFEPRAIDDLNLPTCVSDGQVLIEGSYDEPKAWISKPDPRRPRYRDHEALASTRWDVDYEAPDIPFMYGLEVL